MRKNQKTLFSYNLLRSIGLKTSCFINEYEGCVDALDNYIVITTKSIPEYHWGNYMIFNMPPKERDYEKWCELFDMHFSHNILIKHYAFTWDNIYGERGFIDPFLLNGFEMDKTTVLIAKNCINAADLNPNLDVRLVSQKNEWDSIFKNKLSLKPEGMPSSDYYKFLEKKIQNYKTMVKSGVGNWFVGYLGEDIACDLGIFWSDGIGRLQSVFTCPEFRRQKMCTTLITKSSEYAFKNLSLETLVIEADSDYFAAKIYESVGFKKTEELISISKWNPE